jgi:hypothetical protein
VWNKIKEKESLENAADIKEPLMQELAHWMEQLQAIFSNTDSFREKVKWMTTQSIKLICSLTFKRTTGNFTENIQRNNK